MKEPPSTSEINYLTLQTFEMVERMFNEFGGCRLNTKPTRTAHIMKYLQDSMQIKKTISFLIYDQDIGIQLEKVE
jgi:hypothetical protein